MARIRLARRSPLPVSLVLASVVGIGSGQAQRLGGPALPSSSTPKRSAGTRLGLLAGPVETRELVCSRSNSARLM